MKYILKKALEKAQEAEIFWSKFQELPVVFEANQLKSITAREGARFGLRVVRDGKTGISTCTSRRHLGSALNTALELAGFGPASRFVFPGKLDHPRVRVYDSQVAQIETKEMVEMGQAIIDKMVKYDSEVLWDLRLNKATMSINLQNSRGAGASYRKSIFSVSLDGSLIRGTDMLFVGDALTSCHPVRDTRLIVDSTVKQLEWARDQARTPTKEMPVIFTPSGMASTFFMPLASAFNGRLVLQGASPLGGRLGEKAFDSKISLHDDATISYGPSSKPVDDEGIPVQMNTLIEKGIVSTFLYDLQTAGMAGARSTGNAHRANGGMPSPGVNALVFSTGEASLEDMIADIREGVLVEQLMGAEQGNVLSGEFGGNILLGYKIEQGKIKGRIKDAMLSGNIYNMLKNVSAVGKEGRWVGGALWTPPFYFPKVSVASKEK